MGAASRRKKLDPNYGQVISLSTQSMKYKHSKKIFSELMEQFHGELNALFVAETVPENYQTATEQIKLWLKEQLLTYREPDRAELAKLIFFALVVVQEDVSFSLLAVSCIFKAVKDYLTPDEIQIFLGSLDEAASQERQFYRTDPCAKFAYEEMMISAKLSLAVE